jgi:hypothetical protein
VIAILQTWSFWEKIKNLAESLEKNQEALTKALAAYATCMIAILQIWSFLEKNLAESFEKINKFVN